jgi:hypothetical protein
LEDVKPGEGWVGEHYCIDLAHAEAFRYGELRIRATALAEGLPYGKTTS